MGAQRADWIPVRASFKVGKPLKLQMTNKNTAGIYSFNPFLPLLFPTLLTLRTKPPQARILAWDHRAPVHSGSKGGPSLWLHWPGIDDSLGTFPGQTCHVWAIRSKAECPQSILSGGQDAQGGKLLSSWETPMCLLTHCLVLHLLRDGAMGTQQVEKGVNKSREMLPWMELDADGPPGLRCYWRLSLLFPDSHSQDVLGAYFSFSKHTTIFFICV